MTQRLVRKKTRSTNRRPICEGLEERGLMSAGLSAAAAGVDQAPTDLQGSSVVSLDYEGQIGDLVIRAQMTSDGAAASSEGSAPEAGPESAARAVSDPNPMPSVESEATPDAVTEAEPGTDAALRAESAPVAVALTSTASVPNPLANLLNNSTVVTYPAAPSTGAATTTSAASAATVPVTPHTPAPRGAAALFQQIFKGQHTIQGRWTPILSLFDSGKDPQVQVWKVKVADPPAPAAQNVKS